MLRATNSAKARLINVWVVFEAIRIHGPIPRTGIAETTGLSKQATSDLVDELLGLGFVREEKSEEKRVGKPPKPISIDPDGATMIGLHVDFGRIAAVVTNLGGDVLRREARSIDGADVATLAAELAATVERLRATPGVDDRRFLGIGLATPGPFGVKGINPPRLPGFDGSVLADLLKERTGTPVAFANDGNCAVTAEWRYGIAARPLTNFVYLYLGNGLGTGIVADGALFGGTNGNAGELGHTIAVPGGHRCICGKRGCLETYVSVDSLMRHLAAAGAQVGGPDDLATRFSVDDPRVAAWIEAGLEPLRLGLDMLENLFDPQTIMFGGDAPGWLIEAFIARVEPLHTSISGVERTMPRLMRADLGADAVARGAATLPVLALLDPHFRRGS